MAVYDHRNKTDRGCNNREESDYSDGCKIRSPYPQSLQSRFEMRQATARYSINFRMLWI
ncbi:MAG: hypothetical protein JWO19_3150 [Bryobacterales bacterium]|nr:hypothetical protein [Bryobacterales bacterium]